MSLEENKQVVRRYIDAYHTGRETAILEDIVAEDLQAPTRAMRDGLEAGFPDYRLEIETQVAEEDRVATVWSARGTHTGEWDSPAGPIPPTGREVSWSGTTTLRIADGRIADVLGSNWDHLGILQQLGAVETATPRPGA